MPLYDLQCLEGHTVERFVHSAEDYGCETVICELCGSTMERVLSFGTGLTYFCEKNGRLIENLGHEPVVVTSEKQHRELMRKNGVVWATKGRGMEGQWI